MKTLRAFNALLVLLSIALLPALAATLTAADAKNHIGEQATVCGNVAGEKAATSSRGEPTFINLDAAFPNRLFVSGHPARNSWCGSCGQSEEDTGRVG
jgi:hypothetical protein